MAEETLYREVQSDARGENKSWLHTPIVLFELISITGDILRAQHSTALPEDPRQQGR